LKIVLSFILAVLLFTCSEKEDDSPTTAPILTKAAWSLSLGIGSSSVDSITTAGSINTTASVALNGSFSGTINGYDTTIFKDSITIQLNFSNIDLSLGTNGNFSLSGSLYFLEGSNNLKISPRAKEGYQADPSSVTVSVFVSAF